MKKFKLDQLAKSHQLLLSNQHLNSIKGGNSDAITSPTQITSSNGGG